jgi:hypothetical protein
MHAMLLLPVKAGHHYIAGPLAQRAENRHA